MRRTSAGLPITRRRFAPIIGGVALGVLRAIAVHAQDTARPEAGGPYPRLPGAVTKAPDWLGTDAPFDVARFFAAPPRDRNAAPLYLDALFEFGSNVAVCFPEGPERDRRRQAAEDRTKRYMELFQALQKDPKAVAASSIDEVIKLYDVGFRKLAEAQRRDRCVFESGLGFTTLLPHVQDARQVARIASLRVRRAIERRDFDAAIRDVEAVLRLARDLQPRGGMVNQLVTAAITQIVCADMVSMILASPALRVEHCDRLLKLFLGHEASSSDGYAEGLRADYLMSRVTLHDVVRHQRELAKQMKLEPGESVVKALAGIEGIRANVSLPEDIDARIAQTSPAELSRRVGELNGYYRAMLDLDGLPYATRFEKIAAVKTPQGNDPLVLLTRATMTVPEVVVAFARGTSRMTASLHATECLIVMRRWQLTHRGLPRALAVATREAGLKAIPTDPYDGKPMRLAVLDGQPVVYSVGRDGRDDGGLKDSNLDRLPVGDMIYRLPPVEVRREAVPAR